MKKHIKVKIIGHLENTGIRFHTMNLAYRYNIQGNIKRLSPNKVIIEAEGEKIPLNHFISFCKKGPPGGSIDSIEIIEGELQHYSGFEIS